MKELALSIGEPFSSPGWGSNFVVFSNENSVVVPEEGAQDYIQKCCRYAKHYRVYLVPERFMLMGYQCMCLVAPDGRVIGAQKATHFNTANRIGAKKSSVIEVFDTEYGGVSLCVDVDIYRPEFARIAASMGVNIIICIQQIEQKNYASNMVISGAWSAAQTNQIFVVSVCNQFNCVCAPIALTQHADGFLSPPNLKLPLLAKMHVEKLAACKRNAPLPRKLYAVHRDELIGR